MSLRKVGAGGQTVSHKQSLEVVKGKTASSGAVKQKTGGTSGGGLKKTGGPVQQKSGGSQQGGSTQTKKSSYAQ